jgi:hypothetical protein
MNCHWNPGTVPVFNGDCTSPPGLENVYNRRENDAFFMKDNI